MAEPTYTFLTYEDLDGWAADDHAAALNVFIQTCGDIPRPDWARLCAFAKDGPAARDFFETFFQPVLIEDGQPMLFTGYYEPELRGSLTPDEVYPYPIYRLPDDGTEGVYSRREIEENQPFADRGMEIAWLSDPVDLFFLQVQGSGRIRLPNGRVIRVGYAGKNGRDYTSIGRALVDRGEFTLDEVSSPVIRQWVLDHPEEGPGLLWLNESYVFFRTIDEVPAERGPLGAMNRSITPGRSIAVDPAITLLGAPVWIEKDGTDPMRRLMVAQDTGSAIKGAQRADIYFGTGDAAGAAAGAVKDGGRMVVLMPVEYALAKVSDPLDY
ncbi:membrane-bound lytic murein transglycosylase A [Loktanella atrilutea]|uniref:peptidoglycan lytic exotransglycosylase n=2 Tax=Loktanella atrilutea TaxID=366533 RepID=A0A1M4YP21_LOKAT|nr:murein transglycosylase A [Loktanella atrilutea]SHF07387.1 membrane-bound lytic murein transglycosylase A [Loktanella atrilutea]